MLMFWSVRHRSMRLIHTAVQMSIVIIISNTIANTIGMIISRKIIVGISRNDTS